jgi:hypothetical protein
MTPTKTENAEPSRTRSAPSGAGVEDVTRAVRQVARSSRDLVTDVGETLERELAMAVSISERLRDETVSPHTLSEARSLRVQSGVRDSAHRVVDLIADAVGVASLTIARFGERMADEARPQPHARESAADEDQSSA